VTPEYEIALNLVVYLVIDAIIILPIRVLQKYFQGTREEK
jgi:hypothetical protein